MELISIIVPIYNVQDYLAKCLNSILQQTYSNIEVLCVDDGSTDNSLKILKDYEKMDKRIRVFHQENAGVSIARNYALENVRGDYVLFVDGDDWIDIDTCEKAIQFSRYKKADIVMWSYIRETGKESKPKMIFETDYLFEKIAIRDKLYRRLFGLEGRELSRPENADAICTVWGKLYKTELLENVQFYDIREIGTYEDGLFNIDVFKNASMVYFTTDIYYHYRRDNVRSITSEYNEELEEQWEKLFTVMRNHIKEDKLDGRFLNALDNRIALSIIPLGINCFCAPYSMYKRMVMIHNILKKTEYRRVYKSLEFQYFPFHWNIFFRCAKHRNAIGIFCLLYFIQKLRGKS